MAITNGIVTSVFLFTIAWATGIDGNITAGSDSSAGDHLRKVSIQEKMGERFCAGTVIGEKWILTAARCVTDKSAESIQVVLDTDEGKEHYNVSAIHLHPDFTTGNREEGFYRNNLALLHTDRTIQDADYYRIDLPMQDDTSAGETCTDITWPCSVYRNDMINGPQDTTLLQITRAIILDTANCAEYPYQHFHNPNRTICTLHEDLQTKSGMPNSGGPLVCGSTLAGVSSFAWSCSNPVVYTRVSKYIDWIQSSTGLSF